MKDLYDDLKYVLEILLVGWCIWVEEIGVSGWECGFMCIVMIYVGMLLWFGCGYLWDI